MENQNINNLLDKIDTDSCRYSRKFRYSEAYVKFNRIFR